MLPPSALKREPEMTTVLARSGLPILGLGGATMSDIKVECASVDGGWLARVTVDDNGSSREFEVAVSAAELARFDPAAADPSSLVRRSFEFLLAREPKESILRSFGLSVIGRYFPEYEREIRHS
jgi:hypothetical protein